MERTAFRVSEVVSYLEYKIDYNIETAEELATYELYKWDGSLKKSTYNKLLKEMHKEYRGE